ncbi:MAG TPA: hypothetical protein VH325_03840 [Bryobacteraceae bacterium]|jgi:hypothetical protein|nr:hypothetical protein [Bryobacteraceae bacterium]
MTGFCIANVMNCVNALNLDRSQYSRFPDDDFIGIDVGKFERSSGRF